MNRQTLGVTKIKMSYTSGRINFLPVSEQGCVGLSEMKMNCQINMAV